MKLLAWTVALFAMIAGSIKVYNELEMTRQYGRWADASVRQAEALERAYPEPERDKFREIPKGITCTNTSDGVFYFGYTKP